MSQGATTFYVNAYKDPVLIKIQGRADYMNSQPLADFFSRMLASGGRRFVVDFSSCTTIDSTFLGILASTALEIEDAGEGHCLVLTRLGERHFELVHNLGLDHILSVDRSGSLNADPSLMSSGLELTQKAGAACDKDTILRAHEALTEADSGNLERFQDVIAFLKNQGDQDAN